MNPRPPAPKAGALPLRHSPSLAIMHRCGRTLNHTDAVSGVCLRCGDLLTQVELDSALTKGTPDDPAPHK